MNLTDRWEDPAKHSQAWAERSLRLAALVSGPAVIEFGAGQQVVRQSLIDRGLTYVATDLTMRDGIAYEVDLNSETLAPIPHFDSAILSGVLEYVRDVPRVFNYLKESVNEVVFSYALAPHDLTVADLQTRTKNLWRSHYSLRGLCDVVASAGANMMLAGTWRSQALFRAWWLEP